MLDEYYTSHKEYHVARKIVDSLAMSKEIPEIPEIKDCNIYVYINTAWIPLIMYVSKYPQHIKYFKHLIKKGADPRLVPDTSGSMCTLDAMCTLDIMFYAHEVYLPFLSKHCQIRQSSLSKNIIQCLSTANHQRLQMLIDLKLLTVSDIKDEKDVKDVLLLCLKHMLRYLHYVYNIKGEKDITVNKKEETIMTINKYKKTFEFLESLEFIRSENFINLCLQHYLIEFLPPGLCLCPVYHEDMDLNYTAQYRPLINDRRYVLACEYFNQPIRKEIYMNL